jgi:hypothetical protein
MLKHPSSHWVYGGAHVPQVVPTQLAPASLQLLPQDPQEVTLVRSASHPFAESPSQSAQPGEHEPTAHAPDIQVAVAFASEQGLQTNGAPQLTSGSEVAIQRPPQIFSVDVQDRQSGPGSTVASASGWLFVVVSPSLAASSTVPASRAALAASPVSGAELSKCPSAVASVPDPPSEDSDDPDDPEQAVVRPDGASKAA